MKQIIMTRSEPEVVNGPVKISVPESDVEILKKRGWKAQTEEKTEPKVEEPAKEEPKEEPVKAEPKAEKKGKKHIEEF